MAEHSPEPWTARGDWFIEDSNGDDVIEIEGLTKQDNRDRIVACVNACAGIPTEALEAGNLRAVIRSEWGPIRDGEMIAHNADASLPTSTEVIYDVVDGRIANIRINSPGGGYLGPPPK